ncbi:MAG TPA: Crp/Fnr family transcriptional regulator [Puia sp.]|nr:Crp/Fnr family transcriptional regulator [Puia sp.]
MNIPIKYCTSALSPELNDHYLEYGQLRRFRRHTFLLRTGEVCRNIYFVESGMLRCFYYKGGKEISSWFAQEGDFCWSAESFLRQQPATEYIEVLEDAVVTCLSYTGLECICSDFPLFGMLERAVTQQHLFLSQQKMQAMWMQQSPERLSWFIRQFPHLWGKVPGKYIASYLGITEVMLSRLLNA